MSSVPSAGTTGVAVKGPKVSGVAGSAESYCVISQTKSWPAKFLTAGAWPAASKYAEPFSPCICVTKVSVISTTKVLPSGHVVITGVKFIKLAVSINWLIVPSVVWAKKVKVKFLIVGSTPNQNKLLVFIW